MSDWKESDYNEERVLSEGYRKRQRKNAYFSGNDEPDGLDGVCGDFERACDLAVGHTEAAAREEAHAALRVGRLVLCKREEVVGLILVVADVSVSIFDVSHTSKDTNHGARLTPCPLMTKKLTTVDRDENPRDPPRKRMLLSVQKGISTPEVWSMVSVLILLNPPVSQIAAWRSLILLKPVVATRSLSPIQTTRAPYKASARTFTRIMQGLLNLRRARF